MRFKPKFPRIRLPSPAIAGDLLLLVAGFSMLAVGLYQVYPPAMWIICGALLILAGYPGQGKGAV